MAVMETKKRGGTRAARKPASKSRAAPAEGQDAASLRAERDQLKIELAAAIARVKELETAHRQIAGEIDAAIDAIESVLGHKG
jgi:hypothetical protein